MESIEREYIAQREPSDEIDLVELLSTIWSGKYIIGAIVFFTAAVSFSVLKFSPSYYRVDAIIDVAAPTDIRLLEPSFLQGKNSNEYQVPALDVSKVFDTAVAQLTSLKMQKNFWEKTYNVHLDFDKSKETLEQVKFFKFRKSLSLDATNLKAPAVTSRTVVLLTSAPDDGVVLLDSYLQFLNDQMLEKRKMRLGRAYNANMMALSMGYESLNSIETQKLSDSLIRLKESLKIAESLGIKETPYKDLENVQLAVLDHRDYVLGSKALTQQIEILTSRQSQSLAPYSSALRNIETWRYQIELDLKRLKEVDNNTRMFSIIRAPESSLEPVKPNKMLIFIASILFAGFVGVCIVLIRSAFMARTSRTSEIRN